MKKTFWVQGIKKSIWVALAAFIYVLVLGPLLFHNNMTILTVTAIVVLCVVLVIIIYLTRNVGKGGWITITDKFIKDISAKPEPIPLFGIKTAYLTMDYRIVLKKDNKKIAILDVAGFSHSDIKVILMELKNRGKKIEIDPALDGVFSFDTPQKQYKRHLEI